MRITRQDAKLSSLHPEHLPVRPADPHPVLRPSRRRLQSTVVVRFGRWAPHLLKTIIPALPHPIPIVIFRTAPHNINQAGGGPAIQPLNFKCFCLAVVYDVTIPSERYAVIKWRRLVVVLIARRGRLLLRTP